MVERDYIEPIYYQMQNDSYCLVLINHATKSIIKFPNIAMESFDYCNSSELGEFTVQELISALAGKMYSLEERNPDIVFDDKLQRKFKFHGKVNKKLNNPHYRKIIEEEYKLSQEANEARIKFEDIEEGRKTQITKVDKSISERVFAKLQIDERMPEQKRLEAIAKMFLSDKEKEITSLLNTDENYVKAKEMDADCQEAFAVYFEKYINLLSFTKRERADLFTKEYEQKIDEYAEKGLILHCLNTPDLPIDDPEITIDDVYNYLMEEDYLYLYQMFKTYIDVPDNLVINKKEAEDLQASFDLLISGRYMASLRNLYALIDHHLRLGAETLNGFFKRKKNYRNGYQRSDRITKLMKEINFSYYERAWKTIDKAIGEMNTDDANRFVSRNAIVHGDYKKSFPTAKDVINVFLVYICLRQMIDNILNMEVVFRTIEEYKMAFRVQLDKQK